MAISRTQQLSEDVQEGLGMAPVGTPQESSNIPLGTGTGGVIAPPKYVGTGRSSENFAEQFSRGFWLGAEGGGKRATGWSTFGGALTEFMRVGTDASIELFSEERKQLRRDIAQMRVTNPELADQIESSIGAQRTQGQQMIRLGAALGEGVLTVTPLKVVTVAGRATKLGALAEKIPGGRQFLQATGAMERGLVKVPGVNDKLARHMTTGFAFGGSYGFLAGLQEDADLYDALKGAAIGAPAGMGLALAGTLAIKGAGAAGGAVAKFTGMAKDLIPASLNPGRIIRDNVSPVIYRNFFLQSVGSTMQKYYGDVGSQFVKLYEKAGQAAAVDIGKYLTKYIEAGLMKAPPVAGRITRGVKYVGDDPDFYRTADKILRGEGEYANPVVQRAAIQADERLMLMDITRKNIGALAQRDAGVSLLDPDKYLPKNTPVRQLNDRARTKIANSVDEAEQLAIYKANDEIVADMVEAAYDAGRGGKTLLETYEMYYDYARLVKEGLRSNLKNNRFLADMVRRGQADTLEEARGKILQDMQYRRASLTPRASSLDYSREVNLPWYDPNPTRTLPLYISDSLMRLNYIKNFGRNDEVIKTMLDRINERAVEGASSKATADDFRKMVDIVTGQLKQDADQEAITGWIRAVNVLKLSTAAIVQVGQHLNTLLASDVKALGSGLRAAFTDEGIRQALESGAMTNAFIREMHTYGSTGGTRFADKFLTAVGMTHTDLSNRAVAALAGERYARSEFSALMKRLSLTGADDATTARVSGWMRQREQFNEAVLSEGVDIQRGIAAKWTELFPEANVSLRAGDTKTAQQTLRALDSEYTKNIRTLQKTKGDLEKELLAATEDYTDEAVAGMQERARELRIQLRELRGENKPVVAEAAQETGTASIDEFDAAVSAGLKLREERLTSIINNLEDAIEDAQAKRVVTEGGEAATDQVRATQRVRETPEEKAARINNDLEAIDSEIVRLTNEQADKERLLQGMIDAYGIAENKLRSKFPGAAKYDKFIAERKATNQQLFEEVEGKTRFRSVSNPELLRLRELGIDVEEAVARGYLDRDDILTAGYNLAKNTQFLSRPIDMPAFAASPWGKVIAQFRSFVIQQGQFLKRQIWDDLSGKGDFKRGVRNLVILGTVFPMTGEVIADVRSLVTGRKRPQGQFWNPMSERYWDNIGSVGGTALAFDALRSANEGRFENFIMGPGISEFVRLAENVTKGGVAVVTADGDKIESAGKNLLKQGLNAAGLSAVVNRVDGLKPENKDGETAAEMIVRVLGL